VEDVQSFSNRCGTGDFACFYQSLSKNFYIFGASLGNTEIVNFNLVGVVSLKEIDYDSLVHVEAFSQGLESKIFSVSKLKNGFELNFFKFAKESQF
jgi:hypothetical protein